MDLAPGLRSNSDNRDTNSRDSSSSPGLPTSGALIFHAQPALADPDIPKTPSPPPLPTVSYEWDQTCTTNPLQSGSYSFSSRLPSRLDELRLNLRYDVTSTLLPTKLHLEIKNKEGRVVFRKRQNLYYVKVQERLSTLDAAEDYIMTVTSISGNRKASEDVKIHNRNHSSPEVDEERSYSRSFVTPGYEVTQSVTLPFSNCRSPSDSSLTSGFDERSIDSVMDGTIKSTEEPFEDSPRGATETPVPDLEHVDQEEMMSEQSITSDPEPEEEKIEPVVEPTQVVVGEDKEKEAEVKRSINPFTLIKLPIIPRVRCKWQFGFRRAAGSTYQKVPILKMELVYVESPALLPTSLNIETGQEVLSVPVPGPQGTCAEFVVRNGQPDPIIVYPRDKTGQNHLSSPNFRLEPLALDKAKPGEWFSQQPLLQLEG